MRWTLLIHLFFTTPSLVLGETLSLRLPDNKHINYEVQSVDGLMVSKACAENSRQCMDLLKKHTNSLKKQNERKKLMGHPASEYCQMSGGKNIILEDDKLNQFDFCFFENNYGIDSWQMLKKFKK